MSDGNKTDELYGADGYRAKADAELKARLDAVERMLCGEQASTTDAAVQNDGSPDEREAYGVKHILRSLTESIKRTRVTEDDRTAACGGIHGGHRSRLRELAYRDASLSGFNDITLIELLLSFIVPQRDTNPIAHALIDKFGSAFCVMQASAEELIAVRGMTEAAANILPMLLTVVMWRGRHSMVLDNPFAVAEQFGAMFCRGMPSGTYSLLLDKDFRLISFERHADGDIVPSRATLCATFKYATRYVFLLRREDALFPDAFGLDGKVRDFAQALDKIGVKFIDFMVFTDGGYYTVGAPPKSNGWYVKYIFVPLRRFLRAQSYADLAESFDPTEECRYVGCETAVRRDGLLDELGEILKSKV